VSHPAEFIETVAGFIRRHEPPTRPASLRRAPPSRRVAES
jgi:hypothetical protein